MAGLSYVHNTQYGFLRTSLAGDALDNSNGIVWDLAWLYRYTNGGLTLTPGIGIEWNSETKTNTIMVYRVMNPLAAACAATIQIAVGARTELSANYNFIGNWSAYATARYTHLSDEVTDSPMVDKSGRV